ncbi:MAG: hypothetical protein LBI26_00595 [Holosporales bacterium]|jgi:hypothetical protein|nr:hypothetical protein [Holosporales bacterium]
MRYSTVLSVVALFLSPSFGMDFVGGDFIETTAKQTHIDLASRVVLLEKDRESQSKLSDTLMHIAKHNVKEVECMQIKFHEEMEDFKKVMIDAFAERYLSTIKEHTEKLEKYEEKVIAQDQRIAQLEEENQVLKKQFEECAVKMQEIEAKDARIVSLCLAPPDYTHPITKQDSGSGASGEFVAEENGWVRADCRILGNTVSFEVNGHSFRVRWDPGYGGTHRSIFYPVHKSDKYRFIGGDYHRVFFYPCLRF